MALQAKTFRHMERIVKGFANHRRLEMLDLLRRKPELSVDDISKELSIGYVNASDHIRKLAIAGLVLKRSDGKSVRHKISPRGIVILTFCKKIE